MVHEADHPTYPAISEAQATGIKAEAIFRTLLPPPRWIVNKSRTTSASTSTLRSLQRESFVAVTFSRR
jgi:hypothetical protein